MFHWSKTGRQRRAIVKDDRKFLEQRARDFLSGYLAASETDKELYYEAVAGAASGCQPLDANSNLESMRAAELTAEAASNIAKKRQNAKYGAGLQGLITDAYATTAIAYRRAAGIYANDEKMLKLGTAAVHLLTIATSRMMARSEQNAATNTL
jgi:hypothetical protein